MHTVEDIVLTALTFSGRGDKPSPEDLNQAVRLMNLILKDWATTRGVQLWNLLEETTDLSRADTVLHNGVYYLCYSNHLAASANEPGVGADYQNYWVETPEVSDSYTWTTGTSYASNHRLTLDPFQLDDIITLRLLHEGQFSPIEKISMHEYKFLEPSAQGLPTHAYVEKTAAGIYVNTWPKCNESDAHLLYYRINRPYDIAAGESLMLADQWVTALQYALAVELGFLYNISIERLNVLGQKAQFEFNKAFRTNESEVDKCFVKPCY